MLRKSSKHNKYLWLSQILTQLKDHLPTGVSPRCWRKVRHQCVLLFRPLCSVYIRFPSWDGNANYIPSLLCSQVLSFTFLVVEKRDKAGKKGDPGNEFNGFSVSLRCFSILPRNSQLSNALVQVIICILYGEANCDNHICERFTQIKYYTNKSTKYDVYVRGVRLRMIKDS